MSTAIKYRRFITRNTLTEYLLIGLNFYEFQSPSILVDKYTGYHVLERIHL